MQTIDQFPFAIEDRIDIEMPEGATVVHIESQGSTPCMWAIVDTEHPIVPTRFLIFGTGQPIPASLSPGEHVATFQHGRFVWHVYRPFF